MSNMDAHKLRGWLNEGEVIPVDFGAKQRKPPAPVATQVPVSDVFREKAVKVKPHWIETDEFGATMTLGKDGMGYTLRLFPQQIQRILQIKPNDHWQFVDPNGAKNGSWLFIRYPDDTVAIRHADAVRLGEPYFNLVNEIDWKTLASRLRSK